jgi:spectinomycin phosphotransferase
MLEKPDLQDEKIITCLLDAYGLDAVQVTFLPLGADQNTAVYRIVAYDTKSYFLKLRSGVFDETSVALPKFLSDQGIKQIIPPLTSKTGKLWAKLNNFKVIIYPFIEGRNGYEVNLSDRHWNDFGSALKRIHTTEVPPVLLNRIRREIYSARWRNIVKTFLARIGTDVFDDPVAIELAAFLQAKHAEVFDLVRHAENLAQVLQAESPEFVLCHSDVHAGNILIDTDDTFYVDWDDPILAPKERDLMFVGGAQGFAGHTAQEEERLFYRGYGQTQTNPIALAYYRYERIVEDIAVYCEQLLLSDEGGEDRAQSLHYLKSNFVPGGTIEIAYQSDQTLSKY